METKVNKISNTGYNPKIELMTNSYSTKFYYVMFINKII